MTSRENVLATDVRPKKRMAVSRCLERLSLSLVYDLPNPFGEQEFTESKDMIPHGQREMVVGRVVCLDSRAGLTS